MVWAVGVLMERLIFKLLGVEKKKVSETKGKNADIWGRVIIILLIIGTLPFTYQSDSSLRGIVYLFVIFGFDAFMEWKYIKESKQYIGSLIFMVIIGIAFYSISPFFTINS